MTGRNPLPKAASAGQESCAESTAKMKYSLCGVGGKAQGWHWHGGVCGEGLGNRLVQAAGSPPAQIHAGLEKSGMRSFGQGQAGLGSGLLPAELCTHCTHCVCCTHCTHHTHCIHRTRCTRCALG